MDAGQPEEFDLIPGWMKVPKGESLSPSRDSPEAYRALVHAKDGLHHAEFFEAQPNTEEDEEQSDGLTDTQRAMAMFLAGVGAAAAVVGAVKLVKTVRARTARRVDESEAEELRAASSNELAITDPLDSNAVGTELAAPGLRMTAAEWNERFQQMLLADAFRAEQWRILSDAVVDDDSANVLEAQVMMKELTPHDAAQRIDFIIASNPDGLGDAGAPASALDAIVQDEARQ